MLLPGKSCIYCISLYRGMLLLHENKMFVLLYRWWFQFLAFCKVYLIGMKYLSLELYEKKFEKTKPLLRKGLPTRPGCVAIVTGGTTGIGLETVYELLSKEMHVIIGCCLSPENCLEKQSSLKKAFPQAKVDVWHVDLASMSSVKQFAERFLEKNWCLHLLVNNAGIMCVPHLITTDGFEEHWAVNYLSHCLLTRLLLPRMAESGSQNLCSRVVFVSSSVHFMGCINFADLHGLKYYSRYHSYLQSKLAIVLMTYKLQSFAKAKGYHVTFNCLHPGVVNTSLYRHVWWSCIAAPIFFKTPHEGSETVVYASLAKEMEGIGGKYLENCSFVPSSRLSYDLSLQRQTWTVTWKSLEQWSPAVQ